MNYGQSSYAALILTRLIDGPAVGLELDRLDPSAGRPTYTLRGNQDSYNDYADGGIDTTPSPIRGDHRHQLGSLRERGYVITEQPLPGATYDTLVTLDGRSQLPRRAFGDLAPITHPAADQLAGTPEERVLGFLTAAGPTGAWRTQLLAWETETETEARRSGAATMYHDEVFGAIVSGLRAHGYDIREWGESGSGQTRWGLVATPDLPLIPAERPTPKAPAEYLGIAELAERMGVTASTVRAYRSRGQLPDPDITLGQSPGWESATIEAWLRTRR